MQQNVCGTSKFQPAVASPTWAISVDELERSDEEKDQLSAANLNRLSRDNIKKSGFLTDDKLRNIISYLDEVDTAERLSEIDQVWHGMCTWQ